MKTLLITIAIFTATFSAQAANKIGQRKENQQDRIAQGVKSGELTAKETARIERKEAALNQEVHAERVLNGGKLTAAERKQVNQQQNKLSKGIYHAKHNDKDQ